MTKPSVTFFVELGSEELCRLFSTAGVRQFLSDNGWAVSMGILDLTAERAAIVRDLEGSGVPVTAWLLLDVADGYWFNADNADRAVLRYRETIDWAEREGLRLHRIGLDIEFPRRMVEEFNDTPRRALWRAFRNRRSTRQVYESERSYAALVDEIHAGGRTVESYHFPYLVDERRSGRSLLRRMLGLVDVAVDVEVLMLYASYMGRAAAHAYFSDTAAIALGVTGGGVNADAPQEVRRLLTWERLEEDLLAAARHSNQVYVFSLEGCVWRGFLERFATIDWDSSPPPAAKTGEVRVQRNRRWLQRAMRVEPIADLLLPSLRRDGRIAAADTEERLEHDDE